jgi:hypothetical protein
VRLYVNNTLALEQTLGSGWSYGKVEIDPQTLLDGLNEVLVKVESGTESLERRKAFFWKSTMEHLEQGVEVFDETLEKPENLEAKEILEPEAFEDCHAPEESLDGILMLDQFEKFEEAEKEPDFVDSRTLNEEQTFVQDTPKPVGTSTKGRTTGGGGCTSSKDPKGSSTPTILIALIFLVLAKNGLWKRARLQWKQK